MGKTTDLHFARAIGRNLLISLISLFAFEIMQRVVFHILARQGCRHLVTNARLLGTVNPQLLQPTKLYNLNKPNFCSTVANQSATTGPIESHEFQADTRQLLDIVASSLYSEKEVFIRELISNASDAIEKFRYLRITGEQHLNDPEREPLIDIETDKIANTITFRDNGIGMTSGEMVQNLGTIARSGSKAFMKEVSEKLAEGHKDPSSATNPESIIGQFGVGFYSAFMVADKIEVFSKSSLQADSHTT